MKLRLPWMLAAFAAAFCPVSLICQNNSEPDTSPKTQEEANRILQHGALQKYSRMSTRRSLVEALRESHGRPAEVLIGPPDIANSPRGQTDYLRHWTGGQVCQADLVVVGRMDRQVSGLTRDEALVTSDYYFRLEEIVYSRTMSGLPSKGSALVVNDVGGTVDLPEGRASTRVLGLTSFEPGKSYLLFLRNLGAPGDYEPSDECGAFFLPQSGPPRNLCQLDQESLARYLSKLDSTSLVSFVASVGSGARNGASGCKAVAR